MASGVNRMINMGLSVFPSVGKARRDQRTGQMKLATAQANKMGKIHRSSTDTVVKDTKRRFKKINKLQSQNKGIRFKDVQ